MRLTSLILLLLSGTWLMGQQSNDINQAMQCSITVGSTDSVAVHWLPKADATSYQVHYRTDLTAGYILAGTTTDTMLVLPPLDATTAAEIRVTKFGGQRATGYLAAGVNYLPSHKDRRLLIVVEHTLADSVLGAIEAYRAVLLDERWQSDIHLLPADASVSSVKQSIVDAHASRPLDQVLLVGHVPVPYSGNNAIDGHASGNNHRGAWAADVYYGELDGNWTDSSVDNVEATRSANDNVPGDGKYDQNTIPGLVELAVGRVDFSRLPAFMETEAELTRAYFAKNIQYRTGTIVPTRRGIVDNNFNLGEGFAQGAIKSFTGFWPVDSTHYLDYSAVFDTDYLWSYGAGAGNYRGASGIASTAGFAADSLQTIFTCLFGSYFGDWDNEDNFLRAALASGTTLINAWSGRPVWHFHTMAMGASVGDVLLLVQNDNGNYASQFGNRLTHIALMGDPTLQMYYYPSVEDLEVAIDGQDVGLTWSPAVGVDGYMVYEVSDDGSYTRLTAEPIVATTYRALCRDTTAVRWLVTPVVLEESPSGSYFNQGAGRSALGRVALSDVVAGFDYQADGLAVSFTSTSAGALDYRWDFGDGTIATDPAPVHRYADPGTYSVELVVVGQCRIDTTTQVVVVDITGTGGIGLDRSARLYPNPADETLYVRGSLSDAVITIVDLQGKVVVSTRADRGRIDVTSLPAGLYIAHLLTSDHRHSEVVVIE